MSSKPNQPACPPSWALVESYVATKKALTRLTEEQDETIKALREELDLYKRSYGVIDDERT